MNVSQAEKIFEALECFRIEVPSWGFTNTGTRLGKFIQPAAATTTEEKFSDAGQVHLLTGVCPTVALQVLWDCPRGIEIEQSTTLKERLKRRSKPSPGHSSYLRRAPP
jgi:L-rhamnose isomerase/sugar isomerase